MIKLFTLSILLATHHSLGALRSRASTSAGVTLRIGKMLAAFAVGTTAASLLAVATPNVALAKGGPLTAETVNAALQNVSGNLAPAALNGTSADIRTDGTVHFATQDAGDIVITLPGNHSPQAGADGSQEYLDGNSAVVARPTQGGVQTLLVAANKSAPSNYQFGVNNGYVVATPNAGLLLLDHNLRPAKTITAPWAFDANRRAITTNYTVSASHTSFTQTIAHKADGVKYPVVGDPWMDYQPILWWPGNQKVGDRFTVYFDRFETANMAGVGVGVASALLTRVGIPTWVSPIAVGVARQAAYQSGKCATLQFDLYWGWLPYTTTWVRNC